MIPPHIDSSAIWRHAGVMPHMNRAGIVNSTPEATEELADPMVCDMLLSRMVCRTPNELRARNTTTVSTAAGIEVLIVSPALRPRYVLAAPKTIPRRMPVTVALNVNSVRVWPYVSGTYCSPSLSS